MFLGEAMPGSVFGQISPICLARFAVRDLLAAVYQPLGKFSLMEYFTYLQDLSFQNLYSDIFPSFPKEKKFY